MRAMLARAPARLAAAFMGLALLFPGAARPQVVTGDVPKQVDLVVDGDRLVASNVRFSRFDEWKLGARERVKETAIGEAVIVVVTNQHIIAYGVLSGWRSIDREPDEQVESVSAQDYGGLIVTTKRLLNFNGQSGVWGEQDRRPRQ
ncbi:MAG TPA: hypothetical protein VFV10_07965 [Gammaproteobacteria bacterium]|nr:hypothetical protein [Gammaproteobacteria bacterium]